MLKEIRNVKQESGPGRRRWFEADGLELVVWLEAAGRTEGWQLCYNFGAGEHTLTWREGEGFAHGKVDTGDTNPLKNETPVLVPAGAVPWARLAAEFARESAGLERELREEIGGRLEKGEGGGRGEV